MKSGTKQKIECGTSVLATSFVMATISSRKLVLLGESAVGKSSIALRFCRAVFDDYRESTIGAAFLTQSLPVGEHTLKFEIWDTAGQERYKSLAPMVSPSFQPLERRLMR